ncbi:MAG: hypothetical protein ABIH68_08410 [bacterium]
MLNFIGHLINSLLLLILLIMVIDLIIRRTLVKSGKNIETIPAGPLLRDITAVVLALLRKVIPIEETKILQIVSIAALLVLMFLIKIIVIH